LEFYDSAPADAGSMFGGVTQNEAAAVVAAKLAHILDAHPHYNVWDARQHLRQISSHYASGWVEDGGYGRPPAFPEKIAMLEPAPPLDIRAERAADGKSIAFAWRNFAQSSFAETVIERGNGQVIYRGTGTNFVWRSATEGNETFRFYSKDKAGRTSRPDAYTIIDVPGLASSGTL
jgi:hypothetical protein